MGMAKVREFFPLHVVVNYVRYRELRHIPFTGELLEILSNVFHPAYLPRTFPRVIGRARGHNTPQHTLYTFASNVRGFIEKPDILTEKGIGNHRGEHSIQIPFSIKDNPAPGGP